MKKGEIVAVSQVIVRGKTTFIWGEWAYQQLMTQKYSYSVDEPKFYCYFLRYFKYFF
jgi:hypothetical protein